MADNPPRATTVADVERNMLRGQAGKFSATELRGASCGIGATLIWGRWPVVSKFGVRDTLSAYDIAALRFGVAGILLLPILVGHIGRIRHWPRTVGLAFGAGAPYTLMSVGGLEWAPASHAGIVSPSCSTLFSTSWEVGWC